MPKISQAHSGFLEHFLSEADTTQWIYSPKIIYPDQQNIKYVKEGWSMRPRFPQLSTQLVFLADGNSISACESYLALVQHYRLGTIIGDYTAGANGGANRIILPGGYRFYWTGEYVTLPNGTYYHAQGIQPDILCQPTLEDIRTGKDSALERALRFLGEESEY